ncbi:PRC-barrel domain-containing protein [Pyrococcus abyssi]|uniref:PRC-barrel domain-containing protein n=1 Tax=Pyrococcus abyssi (strain GE5 / Orsay) TaxID=272844 RepID=Q9V279_PYRAB|nr:PRC-barrel domain-containing protein [Pyrococcus abyssi]CAB49119.1 Hypothetical protein PAB3055 [Pyrococcus abyssi GE5]CCE69571.1 TPA: hypothetical protein PAB3055 [Pyrococcus abyssi GE5]
MVMELSKLYGKLIYNTKGKYVGKVDEVVIDIKEREGRVLILALPGERVGVPYEKVVAVGDIILVQASEKK